MTKKKRRKIILNKPMPSTRRDKKLMVFVKNPKTGRVNTIHFGQKGFKSNISKVSRKKFLARSAGIKDKRGRLTKDNKLKANYWTREILWKAN